MKILLLHQRFLCRQQFFLPDNQDIWSRDNLIQTANSMIVRLEYFLPFLKENIEFFDIEESINISQKQRDVVNSKYQIRNALITGFAAKDNKTRFRNIYLTGASLVADAGFEGEIISGINAAMRVTVNRKVNYDTRFFHYEPRKKINQISAENKQFY